MRPPMRLARPILAAALLLPGCATIIEGRTQRITVETDPPGASCAYYIEGKRVADIISTPGNAIIRKSAEDLVIICGKEGFATTRLDNKASAAGAVAGNFLIGGLIGAGVDIATGAANKYIEAVRIELPADAATVGRPPALPDSIPFTPRPTNAGTGTGTGNDVSIPRPPPPEPQAAPKP